MEFGILGSDDGMDEILVLGGKLGYGQEDKWLQSVLW